MAARSAPAAAVRRHRLVAADGLALSVVVASPGAGVAVAVGAPPVLALHGFASSAVAGWERTGHLTALTRAGRVVIAPDLRGHGDSDRPHEQHRYTLDALLRDVATVIADAVGCGVAPPGPWDVLGYSLGARLAFASTRRRLLPVRRLVLGGFDGLPPFVGIDAGDVDRLASGVAGNDAVALRALVAGLAASHVDGTGLPTVPTLLVAGDGDPRAVGAATLAARLPHGSFVSVPDRDHISAVPASAFRRAVVAFLAA